MGGRGIREDREHLEYVWEKEFGILLTCLIGYQPASLCSTQCSAMCVQFTFVRMVTLTHARMTETLR